MASLMSIAADFHVFIVNSFHKITDLLKDNSYNRRAALNVLSKLSKHGMYQF